jgi:hypothetical protein
MRSCSRCRGTGRRPRRLIEKAKRCRPINAGAEVRAAQTENADLELRAAKSHCVHRGPVYPRRRHPEALEPSNAQPSHVGAAGAAISGCRRADDDRLEPGAREDDVVPADGRSRGRVRSRRRPRAAPRPGRIRHPAGKAELAIWVIVCPSTSRRRSQSSVKSTPRDLHVARCPAQRVAARIQARKRPSTSSPRGRLAAVAQRRRRATTFLSRVRPA